MLGNMLINIEVYYVTMKQYSLDIRTHKEISGKEDSKKWLRCGKMCHLMKYVLHIGGELTRIRILGTSLGKKGKR